MSKLIASLLMVSALVSTSAVIAGGTDNCGSKKPVAVAVEMSQGLPGGDNCGSKKP